MVLPRHGYRHRHRTSPDPRQEDARGVEGHAIRLASFGAQVCPGNGDGDTRQRIILCDKQATALQVREASYGLPLLVELLRERRAYLARLEEEYYGGDREL